MSIFYLLFSQKKIIYYIYLYIVVYRLYIDISTFLISFPLLAWLKDMTNYFFIDMALTLRHWQKRCIFAINIYYDRQLHKNEED